MKTTAAFIVVLLLAASGPGPAQAETYRASLSCAKLPFTRAPLDNEPVELAISGGAATYSRTLYGSDRNTVVGKETGTGTLAPDGRLQLSGGWKGRQDILTARYSGKLAAGAGTLHGSQSGTFLGQPYSNRDCTLRVGR